MSLFSAQLFKTPGNSALLVSPHCGWPAEISEMSVATPENREASVMLLVPAYVQYQTAKHYVSACYMEAGDGDIPGNEKQCNALPVSRIVSTMTTGEECPFPGAGVCKADKVRVESQVVDSRDTLGINTPDEDRISVKKSLTCVPIDASKWASDWVDGAPFGGLPGDRFKSYAVGRVPNAAPPFSEFPIVASNYSWDMSREPYTVGWVSSIPMVESSNSFDFIPRDELIVPDSDLTLIDLSSRLSFDERIPDAWFNITESITDSDGYVFWQAPRDIFFLGCLEQYQICASGRCSKPSGIYQLRESPFYGLESLAPGQKAVADLIWKSLWAGQLQFAIRFLGGQILVANEKIMGRSSLRSAKISSVQWVIETWNLANISLAVLQRRPGDYASPAPLLQQNPNHIVKPETPEAMDLCARIKFRAIRSTSFRIFSIGLLVLGTATAAAVNQILRVFFPGHSKIGRAGIAISDWSRYNFHHLLMAVCEERGIAPWYHQEKEVPLMLDEKEAFSL